VNSWCTTTLGKVCDKVDGIIKTGPFGSQLHQSDYRDVGTPVVMPKNITERGISTDDIARIGNEDVSRLSQHKLQPGDIVYGRRGDIGRCALIGRQQSGWLCGTGCLRLSLGSVVLLPSFLFYYLRQATTIKWIYNQAVGATMPNLNTSILRSVPVSHPPLPTQRKIASILSAYDDLIENNLCRIKILEEMAQNLYREWFVKFRFPGYEKVKFVDSPMGKIPEGWEVKSFREVCSLMKSGGTPRRKQKEFWEDGTIDWFKTKELWDCFLFRSEEQITSEGLKGSSAKLYESGTILMAIYGSPTVGRLGILTKRGACNQAALGLVADSLFLTQIFLFYALYEKRNYFNSIAQGAAQQNISKEKVATTEFLLPKQGIVKKFTEIVDPIWILLNNLQSTNKNLRKTRDLLLPKLISGKLDVSDLDIKIPEDTA